MRPNCKGTKARHVCRIGQACNTLVGMRAMVLQSPGPVERNPLEPRDVSMRIPGTGEIRIRVQVCGVCHTDLHIAEGDIHPPRLPIIPGHQVVGIVDAVGPGTNEFREGDRVGVPWLFSTCGVCAYCRQGLENLCDSARFTGFHVNGGYAERIVVGSDSAYPIAATFSEEHAAPLLCAGVIGYRSFRLSGIRPGGRLALFGFGGSAHIVLQIARHFECEVLVFTRSDSHQRMARRLGAAWVGSAAESSTEPADSAIIFAPAGALVPSALKSIRKGGTVALAGITMSDIPPMPYELIYHERMLRSVANSTRQDVHELLDLAAEIPLKTTIQSFPLEQANVALEAVKHSRVDGAAVLRVSF
jgi:propanol-preferring alcohol dehydrogenase